METANNDVKGKEKHGASAWTRPSQAWGSAWTRPSQAVHKVFTPQFQNQKLLKEVYMLLQSAGFANETCHNCGKRGHIKAKIMLGQNKESSFSIRAEGETLVPRKHMGKLGRLVC